MGAILKILPPSISLLTYFISLTIGINVLVTGKQYITHNRMRNKGQIGFWTKICLLNFQHESSLKKSFSRFSSLKNH